MKDINPLPLCEVLDKHLIASRECMQACLWENGATDRTRRFERLRSTIVHGRVLIARAVCPPSQPRECPIQLNHEEHVRVERVHNETWCMFTLDSCKCYLGFSAFHSWIFALNDQTWNNRTTSNACPLCCSYDGCRDYAHLWQLGGKHIRYRLSFPSACMLLLCLVWISVRFTPST